MAGTVVSEYGLRTPPTSGPPPPSAGRLYHLAAGFPALEITEEAIITIGTSDPLTDAEAQTGFTARDLAMPKIDGDWDIVHGELVIFPAPVRDLPPLDDLGLPHMARIDRGQRPARRNVAWLNHQKPAFSLRKNREKLVLHP